MTAVTISQIKATLHKIITVIERFDATVIAVYLFGSSARQNAKETSDLDLAFLIDPESYKKEPLEAIAPAYLAATRLGMTLNKETDVTILNASSIEMTHEVVTTGIRLYDSDAERRVEYEIAAKGMYYDFKPFLEKLRHESIADL